MPTSPVSPPQPPAPPTTSAAPPTKRRLLTAILFGVLMLVPLTLALLGAWVGTSLTVHLDGPTWLALVGSIVVFAVIPLVWERLADPDQRGGRIRDAILRSSLLSAVLVVVLVAAYPESTFKALATRGDWFLAGSKTPAAESIRKGLFSLANGLEWLNDSVRDKPFSDVDDSHAVDPGPVTAWTVPAIDATAMPAGLPEDPATTENDTDSEDDVVPDTVLAAAPGSGGGATATPTPGGIPIPGTNWTWPLAAEVHPAVTSMPVEARKTVESVAAWLKAKVPDPLERAKAVHDFVTTHVRYDYERLYAKREAKLPLQTAQDVIDASAAICAGYATLTRDLGVAAGLEFIRISGDSRDLEEYEQADADNPDIPIGAGHAWNAVRVNGRWYLMDTTKNAGGGSRKKGFTFKYQTTYLFTPPEAMILTHLPNESRWQLLEKPLSRAEWMRQPMLRPHAKAWRVDFVGIDRPVVPPMKPARFAFANERRARLSMQVKPLVKGAKGVACGKPTATNPATFVCDAPVGPYRASVFARQKKGDKSTWLGGVIVEAR